VACRKVDDAAKSTTLRCLAGLDRPERGAIRFGDEIWFDGIFLPPQRRERDEIVAAINAPAIHVIARN